MPTIPQPGSEVEPRPWQTGIAPVYIGMFLWVAYFDQIGRRALPIGGLGWSILGASAAGPLAYWLLFRPSATWGFRVGKPLDVVSTSTFGIKGAALVPGLLLGLAQVVLFALAVGYAIDLTLQALAMVGLVDPRALRAGRVGGATLRSPLFLAASLFWAVATALVSLKFIRWIAYLMQFFPIFPAALVAGAMLTMMVGLPSFRPTRVDPMGPPMLALTEGEGHLRAFLLTLQWTFAYSALAGVMGADWGSGSLTERDVRVGGRVGLALSPAIVAALALIAVAGYQGSREALRESDDPRVARLAIEESDRASSASTAGASAPPFSFVGAAGGGFGPTVGAVMLGILGLASLGPAVYSSFSFGLQFRALGPGISRLAWTMMGTFTAWLLIVGGWFDRTEAAFDLLGATFAPVAGAIAADYRRQRGRWPGPRLGLNPAGLLAWPVGFAVGLAPILGRAAGVDRLAHLQPASVWAFLAAYLAYEALALLRLESAAAPHGWAVSD